jgi:hypothetical protein
MKFYPPWTNCENCSCRIEQPVLRSSLDQYNFSLCISCQRWLHEKKKNTCEETISLYFSLKKRNILAELEDYDGYKTVEIAVTNAKVNIEVQNQQYNTNSRLALSHLQKTFHAFKKGNFILRIPNALVKEQLELTADYIKEFVSLSIQKNESNAPTPARRSRNLS